ncbi:MAG: bifunctional (p)ppGpp synthetase/guanosine-3',5'-bis(diphosphate) 3'-pyrophosphohydrolase [Oscillospiraceae bacterium]|jgi:GTP pyrophosphokinase|nr:bifunctional (p)ppGpp synthetase/guanosine-3',5'-bis(diphosphate) 3'-pyrophosphohydrolase [Oscillospiraceae bacterium]
MNCTNIDVLMSKILAAGKGRYDLEKIMAAYELANDAHEGQLRSSGEPYISHPLAVACILLEFNMDTDTIAAAILHDILEDTDTELKLLKKRFGGDVAFLVDGVTKIGQVPFDFTKEEQEAENTRKILMAMSKDERVILIKLADRLHNMRTLEFRSTDKQRQAAFETMNFFAPIAHRLGMNSIKEEMEDLSIRYLDPYGFMEIEKQINQRKEQRNTFISKTKIRILERVGKMEPAPVIVGRVKSAYSIYKKVIVEGKNFDEIYDIYAVRIILQSVIECYNILGVIHDMFRPLPGRFKDYIATPKPNRYQSLHTTVVGRDAIPFEVQIRTQDMHETAEYGVAAHWKYKGGLKGKSVSADTRVKWIRHILEQQQEAEDIGHLAEAIKTDLATDDVYVFTPKGDIITLPLGATVIDFAYAIHSGVGNKMYGAKVNGRMVNLEYKLEIGNLVEIVTKNSDNIGPNRNWLDIVKTNQAKAKIRAWLKKERRPENIAEGKKNLERELKRNSISLEEELLKKAAKELRYESIDELFAAIGYGGIQMTRVMSKIKEIYAAQIKSEDELDSGNVDLSESIAKKQSAGVIVEGIDNCLIRFANCCTPLPGDEITGFVTRGYGVSVHKKDCANVIINSENYRERLINVSWVPNHGLYFRAAIEVIAVNRHALISEITGVISENRFSICEIKARELKNGNACIEITLEIANIEQLKGILTKLQKVTGVIMATRRDG